MQAADSNDGWHGWSMKGPLSVDNPHVALHIGPLPGRKSICLYTIQGSVLKVRGYFRSEDDAIEALKVLDELIRVSSR